MENWLVVRSLHSKPFGAFSHKEFFADLLHLRLYATVCLFWVHYIARIFSGFIACATLCYGVSIFGAFSHKEFLADLLHVRRCVHFIWCLNRGKYERAMKELEYSKKRLAQQHEDDLEQLLALKKQLEKKVRKCMKFCWSVQKSLVFVLRYLKRVPKSMFFK
jgi:hypothetical protein